MKKLIIFASGSKDGGGSGFANLVNASRNGILEADIVAVVSNHEHGGVREKADKLGVPFKHFAGPYTESGYEELVAGADFVALSGWLKLVKVRRVGFLYGLARLFGRNKGLDPRTTFNIHPGPLPRFGGAGMYGHHVHEAVMEAYHRGEVKFSEVTMHFVTPKYDEGPVFFRMPVEILTSDTAETLGARVNQTEHAFQPAITDAVLRGRIRWNGKDSKSLVTIDHV